MTRFYNDGGTCHATKEIKQQELPCFPRNSSETDLGYLEKTRNLSQVNDFEIEDDVERELEAYARKASITLMMDSPVTDLAHDQHWQNTGKDIKSRKGSVSSRKSSTEIQDRQLALTKTVSRNSAHSDDSGCDSKGQVRKAWRSLTSSTSGKDSPGSLKRKRFAQCEARSVEDDVFEAELEEKARKESLIHITVEPVEILDSVLNGTSSDGDEYQKEMGLSKVNESVRKLLVNDINEDKDREVQLPLLDTLNVEYYDDDYQSSSSNLTPSPICIERSPLGMSLDSYEEPETPVFEAVKEAMAELSPKKLEDLTSPPESTSKNRRSSTIDDLSLLCSDCKKLRQRCEECTKLFQSQASLIIHERRFSFKTLSPSDESSVQKSFGSINGLKCLESNCSEEEITSESGGKLECGDICAINSGMGVNRSMLKQDGKGAIVNRENGMEVLENGLKENGIRHGTVLSKQGEHMKKNDNKRKSSRDNLSEEVYQNVYKNCRENTKHEESFQVHKVHREPLECCHSSTKDSAKAFTDDLDGRKVYPVDKILLGDISRQDKVGYWLSSLSDSSSAFPRHQGNNGDLDKSRSDSGIHSVERSRLGSHDEDVFYRKSAEVNNPERPRSLSLPRNPRPGFYRDRAKAWVRGHRGSTGSDGSSTKRSGKEMHLNKSDLGKYGKNIEIPD